MLTRTFHFHNWGIQNIQTTRFETTPPSWSSTNHRSRTHDKSVFYYFCRWHLRGRDAWHAKRRRIFRRERRGRKRSERIRPPFAFAVVKKAKSDRLSPDNKDSPKDKATLSPATERRTHRGDPARELMLRINLEGRPKAFSRARRKPRERNAYRNDRDI